MNQNRKQALKDDYVLHNCLWMNVDGIGRWVAPIPNFKDYWATSCGEIISMKKKISLKLKQINNGNGYLYCMLYVDGKNHKEYVHRLVVEAFLHDGGKDRNAKERSQVNHVNGNKTNNKLANLERCSPSENMYHLNKVLKTL
uniref:NUMOD4 domain-containing protein n=1 Tax=Polynucleobacter sp. TaxID=2029855 RepID=UPI0040481FFA